MIVRIRILRVGGRWRSTHIRCSLHSSDRLLSSLGSCLLRTAVLMYIVAIYLTLAVMAMITAPPAIAAADSTVATYVIIGPQNTLAAWAASRRPESAVKSNNIKTIARQEHRVYPPPNCWERGTSWRQSSMVNHLASSFFSRLV